VERDVFLNAKTQRQEVAKDSPCYFPSILILTWR